MPGYGISESGEQTIVLSPWQLQPSLPIGSRKGNPQQLTHFTRDPPEERLSLLLAGELDPVQLLSIGEGHLEEPSARVSHRILLCHGVLQLLNTVHLLTLYIL